MIRWLCAAGALAALFLLLGCAAQKQTAQPSSIPTTVAERSESVDCGSGETLSTDDFPKIVLDSGDVAGNLTVLPTSAVAFDDLGDQYFKDTVDPSRYVGGLMAIFVSGEILQGGRGHLLTSIVMAFTDAEAATILTAHPSVGEAEVNRRAETLRFGDATDSRYIETSWDGDKLAGHIISFRVGRIVTYIGDLAAGEDTPLGETERLARLVCDRIRQR